MEVQNRHPLSLIHHNSFQAHFIMQLACTFKLAGALNLNHVLLQSPIGYYVNCVELLFEAICCQSNVIIKIYKMVRQNISITNIKLVMTKMQHICVSANWIMTICLLRVLQFENEWFKTKNCQSVNILYLNVIEK